MNCPYIRFRTGRFVNRPYGVVDHDNTVKK